MLKYFKIKRKKYLQLGFTMIEILIVIGIIGLLSTTVMASVNRARGKAKITKAKSDIDVLHKAITQLMFDTGEWPGHQTPESVTQGGSNEIWDLSSDEAGLLTSDGGLYDNWNGPYIKEIPKDPWGNDYFFDTDYRVRSNKKPCNGAGNCSDVPAIGSFGPDGVGHNQYNSDDIIKIVY